MSTPVNPFNRLKRFHQRKLYITRTRDGKKGPAPLFFLKQADTTSFILLADGSSKLMKAE